MDEVEITADGTARVNRTMNSVFGPSGQYIVKTSKAVNGMVMVRSKSKDASIPMRRSLVFSDMFDRLVRDCWLTMVILLDGRLCTTCLLLLRRCNVYKLIKRDELQRNAKMQIA